MREAAIGLLTLCFACSSAASSGSSPAEAGPEDGSRPVQDAAGEATADGSVPEAAADARVPDGQADAAAEAGPEDAPYEAPGITDGPFPACMGNDPGDGGTRCAAYSESVDGAIVDEAGNPTGLGAQEACTKGQPCTVCLMGYLFPGFCE